MNDQERQELTNLRQEVARLKAIEARYLALTQKTNGKHTPAAGLFAPAGEQMAQDCRTILEIVPIPVFVSRLADGLITFANTYAGELVGVNPAELLGHNTQEFYVNPADREFVVDAVRRDGHLFHHELQIKRADGSELWVLASMQALEFEGEPSVYVGLYDVTERRLIEHNLRRSEAQFKAILNAMPDLIFSVRRDGTVLDLRGGHDATLYKTEAEIIGRKIPEILPPHLVEQRLYYLEQAFKSGELQYFEFEIETDKGLRHEEGRFILANQDEAVHIIRDVTDRRQAEIQLAQRATALEAVARVSAVASSILDVEQLLQQVTDLTKKQFGLYHTHIYLLNPAGDTLNLAAGAGEVGVEMVAQGWNIPLDSPKSLVAQAARTRAGLVVNNVAASPIWLPNKLLPATRSEMAVPIIVADKLLGVLDVQSDQVDHFTAEDLSIKTTLAAQIGIALQNARTFARQQETGHLLHERVKELDCLNDIGHQILDRPALDEFLEWVVARIPQAMQAPDLCVTAIEYNDRLFGHPQALNLPAKIVNALRVSGQIVGRIHIAYTQPLSFLDEESAMLGGIASRVGGYIENQQAQAEILRRNRELDMLNRIITASMTEASVQSQLEAMCRELAQLFDVPQAAAAILNPQRTAADVIAEYCSEGRPSGLHYSIPVEGNPSFEYVLATKQPLAVEQARTDPRVEAILPLILNRGIEALLLIPLIIDDEVVGSLGLDAIVPRHFTPEEIHLAQAVAQQAANVLAQAKLTEERRQLATIVENHPDFIGVATMAGQPLYINPAGLKLAGYPPGSDVTALNSRDFFPPAEFELLTNEGIPAALAHGYWTRESRLRRVDGSVIPVEQTLAINYDAAGQPRSLSVTLRDISDRKHADQEREQLLAEVEDAYRQYVRREWTQYLSDKHQGQVEVKVVNQAVDVHPALQVPIALRGQSIGTLSLQDVTPNRSWTEDEQALIAAVTEQLALTVENLRLFDNTQQQVVREQLTREITDKMRVAPDVDTIIQTGLSELARVLAVSRTYVKLTPVDNQPEQ